MPGYRTTLGDDGSFYVVSLEDNNPLLTLRRMDWESDFFAKKFGKLEIAGEAAHYFGADASGNALKALLSSADNDDRSKDPNKTGSLWIGNLIASRFTSRS